MRSVTLVRMRHLMLVLGAAAVLVVMRGFSAAPAMADPGIIEPAELTITEPVFDNDLGFVSFDNDLGHGDLDHTKADNASGLIIWGWDRI